MEADHRRGPVSSQNWSRVGSADGCCSGVPRRDGSRWELLLLVVVVEACGVQLRSRYLVLLVGTGSSSPVLTAEDDMINGAGQVLVLVL